MFFILLCKGIKCTSLDDYNILFTNFRNELTNYFSGETQPISERTQITNEPTVHAVNTVFERCSTSTDYGGAIFYSKPHGKILVEFSTFSACSSKDYGGAICVRDCDCDCVIYCVCCNNCSTITTNRNFGYGQFIYTYLKNNELDYLNIDKLNYLNSSSVCFSEPKKNDNNYPICLCYGKQICTSVNVSNNKVTRHSAIYFNYGSDTSYITFCSINSNTASNNGCIFLNNNGTEYEIDTCNIINNDIGSGNGDNNNDNAVITCQQRTKISNCCILGNTISESITTKIFYAASGVTISLFDSCVEGSLSSVSESLNVITENNKFYLNYLRFTETGEYCYSGIDQVGELTPIPDPITKNLKKQTCEHKNYYNFIRFINYPTVVFIQAKNTN